MGSNLQLLPGYRGNGVHGLGLSGCNFVTVSNVALESLRSVTGKVYGIDILRDTSDIEMTKVQIARLVGHVTAGVRASSDSSNVKMSASCISEAQTAFLDSGLGNTYTPQFCGLTAKLLDVTEAAGLPAVYKGLTDIFNPMIGGAAVGDFDNDGWVDLFLPRMTLPNVLLRNNGNKTFTNVVATSGLTEQPAASAGFVDIDNDGDLDLYLVGHFSPNRLYLNTDGHFTDVTQERGIRTPGVPTGFSVGFGDYDLDGCLDIISTQWTNNPTNAEQNTRIFRNKCGAEIGHFEDVTVALGLQAPPEWSATPTKNVVDHCFGGVIADLTGDKFPEILMVCDFFESIMLFNNRNGSFKKASDFMTGGNDMGATVFDFDLDGRFDVMTTDIGGKFDETVPGCCVTVGHTGNRVYKNLGNGCYKEVQDQYGVRTGGWGWGVVHFDYENDGNFLPL